MSKAVAGQKFGSDEVGPIEDLIVTALICGDPGAGKTTLVDRLFADTESLAKDDESGDRIGVPSAPALKGAGDFADLLEGVLAENQEAVSTGPKCLGLSTGGRRLVLAGGAGGELRPQEVAAFSPNCDLAIVLVDAHRGILSLAKRQSFIASVFGVRRFVLVVNKMDLVGYDQGVFDQIVEEFREFAAGFQSVDRLSAIPVSALNGQNIDAIDPAMPWYQGHALLEALASPNSADGSPERAFLMSVQSVDHRAGHAIEFEGRISSGALKRGDKVRVVPGGQVATVDRITVEDGDLETARDGQLVVLKLDREFVVSRGDVLAAIDDAPMVADQFDVTIVWLSDVPLLAGRRYELKLGTQSAQSTVTKIRYVVNTDNLEHVAANQIDQHDIASCNISIDRQIPFTSYSDNRDLGGFVLFDTESERVAGVGAINFSLRRADNVHMQALDVDRSLRAKIKHQKPAVLWFTGLSGSGKSTIANVLERNLVDQGYHTVLLDGDNVRHGLNRDLGFTDADRVENIRRIAEVAKLMTDAGLIVLVSFISPFRAERAMARELMSEGEFFEIHVNTPLEVVEQRDVKGLYKKARSGLIKNFTGIDSPYEAPETADIEVNTADQTAEEAATRIEQLLRAGAVLGE